MAFMMVVNIIYTSTSYDVVVGVPKHVEKKIVTSLIAFLP